MLFLACEKMEKGWVIWFTGLHGAGKTTIAERLADIIRKRGISLVLLDGDVVRSSISSDLGYTVEERNKHLRRVADVCKLISDNMVLSIACVASPTEQSRSYARNNIKNFFLVYVKCPLDVCEKRDVKGHYKKVRNKEGGFGDFIGVTLNFEEPEDPDVILNTDNESVEESVNKLLNKLVERNIIMQ